MSKYEVKVFIVQKASGEVIAAKLRFADAHAIALQHAPAKVLFALADKTPQLNVMAHEADRGLCN